MSETDQLKLKLIDTQLQLLQTQAVVLQFQREQLTSQAAARAEKEPDNAS